MSVDVLQEKIRKCKNPTAVDLSLPVSALPFKFAKNAGGYGEFCREMLSALKGTVPAVRLGFAAFGVLGAEGLNQMSAVLTAAREEGYYVLLDAPEILSVQSAGTIAEAIFGDNSQFPCDGLVVSAYCGSDFLKPFLPYCKDGKKDIFAVVRTANKSAPEMQDLLTGSRLVHAAAADMVNRYGADTAGKFGYSRVGIMAGASSAESLRSLRAKYPRLFLLVDGADYPNANAKNCSHAFDKFGHGAVACVGTSVTCAWKQAESDGFDFAVHAVAAAERMKKNLTRYVTVL